MRDEFERWYANNFMPMIDDGDEHIRSFRTNDGYSNSHISEQWIRYKSGKPASKRIGTFQRVVIFLALFAIWCAIFGLEKWNF